jgi:hypothetical protein
MSPLLGLAPALRAIAPVTQGAEHPKIGIEVDNRWRFPTAEGHTPFPDQRIEPIFTRILQAENSLLCPFRAKAPLFRGETG